MAGTFQFLICLLCISVPALTGKVKVVAIKICIVKLHCFCLRRKCTSKNEFVNRKFYFFENRGGEQNFIWWAVMITTKKPHRL